MSIFSKHIPLMITFISVFFILTISTTETSAKKRRRASRATPFSQGRVQVALGAGTQSAFSSRYFVIGGGASYFVLDGLSAGLSGQMWVGGPPALYVAQPHLTYTFHQVNPSPYVGVLYQQTWIGAPYEETSGAVGARAGFNIQWGSGLFLTIGGRLMQTLDCADDQTCQEIIPEVGLSLSL
jgi:hypothetical protein